VSWWRSAPSARAGGGTAVGVGAVASPIGFPQPPQNFAVGSLAKPQAGHGSGVFINHGTGLVVGETAVIGDDVSILHEMTLGGTGKERGDRHPKVWDGVLLCAGAKVLGNVERRQGRCGQCCRNHAGAGGEREAITGDGRQTGSDQCAQPSHSGCGAMNPSPAHG
jgi:hypothetical protein